MALPLLDDRFEISPATLDDIPFLGQAIRDAERANEKNGLWDLIMEESIKETEIEREIERERMSTLLQEILALSCHQPDSVYYYKRFLIIREKETKKPIATACGYHYPDYSISHTISIVLRILQENYSWNNQEIDKAYERLGVLEHSLPSSVDWESGSKKWIIEAVFTDSSYRGNGLGKAIVSALCHACPNTLECPRCWITCSVGNEVAFHVYQRVGFQLIGDGNSSDCVGDLRYHILEYLYSPLSS